MKLVTGASGFIGGRLLGNATRALVRNPAGLINEVVGDLLDPATLSAACQGVSTVVHCAGHAHAASLSDAALHWRINYEGTRNLLTAAGEAGVKRFIFLSSVKAMAEPGAECVDESWPGEPAMPYGKAKRAAEAAVLEAGVRYGMHVVNLRLAMVYGRGGRGNLQRMAAAIRAGWFPPLPETGNKRSIAHVDDVVEAVRITAEHPEANGRTYIVADPNPYSGRQILDAIRAVLHKPPVSWNLPVSLSRAGGTIGSFLEARLGHRLPLNSETVSRLLDSECYSPRRIERELGWCARIGLNEGLQEMLHE